MVKDINAGGNSSVSDIIRVGDLSYFTAGDGTSSELGFWVSDGTEAGTIKLPASAPGDRIEFN